MFIRGSPPNTPGSPSPLVFLDLLLLRDPIKRQSSLMCAGLSLEKGWESRSFLTVRLFRFSGVLRQTLSATRSCRWI